MDLPSYEGLIDQWKVDLIVDRAVRMGFRKDELPDVLQEVVLVLLKFKYESMHDSSAQEKTVLTSVIDNQLMNVLRGKTRYSGKVEEYGQTLSKFSHTPRPWPLRDIPQKVPQSGNQSSCS